LGDRLIKGSWLEGYLAYTAESESPEEYHLWVGISAIAGALRRRVFFDMGYFLLYPNMYVVLVGPAGRCKKSTAMRVGRQMLSQVPGLDFTTDSVTRERLIQDLTQAYKDGQSAMTAYSSEFASLLTSSGMDMVVFLTDIFDSPMEWSHKTKAGGTNKIKQPYLNLLAATTPSWISTAMPLDTVGIGLTSRIVFVFQDTPRIKPPFPELSEAQKLLGEMLVKDLTAISVMEGQFQLSPEAKAFYTDWYTSHIGDPNKSGDPRLAGYYERKPMHLLKLAMIVSASIKDDPIFTLDDLQHAMTLFDKIEKRMPKVFASVGKNPLFADREEVYNAILLTGGMTIGELNDKFGYALRKDEVAETIDTLMLIGKVRLGPGGLYQSNK
jgi:hypothetical protein